MLLSLVERKAASLFWIAAVISMRWGLQIHLPSKYLALNLYRKEMTNTLQNPSWQSLSMLCFLRILHKVITWITNNIQHEFEQAKKCSFFPLEKGEINCVIKNRDEVRKKNCLKYFVHLDNPRRSHMEYEQVLTERSLIKKYAYWK